MSDAIYVAFGGGVNSTGMLVGLYEREIAPDWIVFADTSGEKPETYSHVAEVNEWLRLRGASIMVLHKDSMYATLEDECLTKNTLPALAFGFRSCSDKWKQAPQQKYMNNNAAARAVWKSGQKVTKAIGFGVDEMRRAKEYEDKKYRNWYPLVEWGWDRAACIEAIKRGGLTVPPKSSCFYCPAMRKTEIVQLATQHPDLHARALAMEKNATAAHSVKGLGRSFAWASLIGPETVEQACTCFDGEGE